MNCGPGMPANGSAAFHLENPLRPPGLLPYGLGRAEYVFAFTPVLHKQHGKGYLIVSYYSQYHSENTIF